ncbi:branched-chain amino acid ABC transporter permease [Acidisphaera rubrifaciens]|uniref:Innermembrane translocator n=1 Tax=Acidisphaera rubrifaciens HS-AP3 TaxID=1231350 RepID=A0A0D6P6I6_9PROT|nr:branched-chain amino acid ABC transporter permease [Acidisphaera rubrifaciens]GAN76808.1 innermembrane translocator [Acidisphaera rubrifaciens HS-AP3]
MSPRAATHLVAGLLLLAYPLVASPFFVFQIGAYSLILGTIALSLMILAGYGGMVSLAQMMVAGVAGYLVAILGTNESGLLGFGWPWWLYVPVAVLIASVVASLIGLLAVRSAGIYMIMITLAVATAFFYFARQNYAVLNGFNGFHGVVPPHAFGIAWRRPIPFYYLCLAVAAAFYAAALYGERSTFGLALQAVRDNPRRMRALGFNVPALRVFAFFLAGVIAATAGVLLVWFNSQISPGTISVAAAIDTLVIAVVGGIRRPAGPYFGALLFAVLQNFAIDLIDPERFNTVIGIVFLAVVLLSPDGLLGLFARLRNAVPTRSFAEPEPARPAGAVPQRSRI